MARILIVDDAGYMRKMIRKHLTDQGHEIVAEAANGVEAVQLYKQHHPDLTTMDITMAEMTGTQALREIRKYDPKARVIMISALNLKKVVMDAVCVEGAVDFLIKPFTPEQLKTTVQKALSVEL